MTMLSPHLSLAEMTRSQTALRFGLDNTPPDIVIARMRILAVELFERTRDLLGVPIQINSGFRCVTLNSRIGGATNSAHLTGDAMDIVPMGMDLLDAFDRIRFSALPFDQVIEECGSSGWIHLAQAREGRHPRHQALRATGGPGAWQYVIANP